MDFLDDNIVLQLLLRLDDLGFLGICLGQINFGGHEGAVFLNDLSRLVLVAEFQTIFIEEQRDLCADLSLVPLVHGEFRTAVTLPVYRLCTFLVGQRVDVYLIRHHECRIEAQTEVTDNLIRVTLVLIFLNEIRRTGKSNLVDILVNLFRRHSQTVVGKGQGLLLRVNDHVNPCLIILRQGVLAHHVKLFQLCHCITAVGDQLPVKNIMV